MEVIPLDAVPITGITTTTTTTTTEIPATTTDASRKISEIHARYVSAGEGNQKIAGRDKNLQQLKSTFQSSYNTEMHTTQRLKLELQKLQKETIAAKTLAEAKENIWMDICKSMTEIWPLIQIMYEQHELIQRSKNAIDKIRGELGERPTEANKIIRFLNSKTREELEALEIEDRT
jgi:hypothetical protein